MNLYLTRIRIDSREAARLRLTDAYAWHQTLWHAFPDRNGQQRDFLTRIDRRGPYFEALILSPDQPTRQPWGIWESKRIPESFFQHQHYGFSLRANPTQMRVVRDAQGVRRNNGQRTGIYQPDQLLQWIHRKLEAAGCRVLTVTFDPPVREHFYRKGRRGVHIRVDFRGVLEVVERDRFLEAVHHGIGRARGFGFGMLLLQPLSMTSATSVATARP